MAIRNAAGRGRRRMMSQMNVVPYIDVMLVLVVILMVAAPFVNPSIVDLPKVAKAAKAPTETVEVIVHPDGMLSLRSGKELRAIDLPSLVSRVRSAQQGADTPVVIAADKDVRYEQVINVMRSLQQADLKRVGLALKLESTRR